MFYQGPFCLYMQYLSLQTLGFLINAHLFFGTSPNHRRHLIFLHIVPSEC